MSIGFHLPEAPNEISLLITLADTLNEHPEYFRDDVKIASFFGCPPLIWNGGRMMLGPFRADRFKATLDAYNERGIPYRFTFTNPMLTEEHLSNRECNMVLDMADNGMNEVIVYSELLENHIRKTHPNMKVTSSTCKCIRSIEDVKAELAKDYSLVVLDYNFNNDFETLEKLTPEERKRCEILSNPVCVPNCPRRHDHYESIGKTQVEKLGITRQFAKMDTAAKERYGIHEWDCPHRGMDLFNEKSPELNRLKVTPDSIYEKYVPMGFENFKLEGRGANIVYLCEQIVRYMAKPEMADRARVSILATAVDYFYLNY